MPDDHVFRRNTGVLTGPFVARRIVGGVPVPGGDDGIEIAEVTGLQTALDGKAASSHTHIIANVTGLQTALDDKAASSHTHSIANVTGLQTALDGKAATSHTHTPASLGAAEVLSSAWPGYIRIVSGANVWHVEATQVLGLVTDITGTPGNGEVVLDFNYLGFGTVDIYRSTGTTFSAATLLTSVAGTGHTDTTVENETTYYYWFVNRSGTSFSEPTTTPLEVTTDW